MKIPFFKPYVQSEEKNAVLETLESEWLTSGQRCKSFELAFSEMHNAPYAVALNSCTAALHLAVAAAGLERGDYVLVPSMTFAATAEILYYLGAHPILVDCRESDLTICPDDTQVKLRKAQRENKRVRGIIVVHYAGKMVDMDWVDELSQNHNLFVVEDAAHCCGSQYFSKKRNQWCYQGERSIAQCYSFYSNKCITTCGEGGMLLTNSQETAEKIRSLSLHGLSSSAWSRFQKTGSPHYDIQAAGFKYNLTDVAAAMGIEQLKRNTYLRTARKTVDQMYRLKLKEVEEIRFLENEDSLFVHSHHLCVIRLNTRKLKHTRDEIVTKLKAVDITTSIHWKPLHLHSFYTKQGFLKEDLPRSTAIFEEILSLPLYAQLSEEELEYVCDNLKQCLL